MQLPALVVSSTTLPHDNDPLSLWIQPLEGKSSISIDQVHELETALTYRTSQTRTIFISPAERLTLPAQQALLKTLEEPPDNTQIILVTDVPNKLLPTILSRVILSRASHPHIQPVIEVPLRYDALLQQKISDSIKLSDTLSKNKEETLSKLKDLLDQVRIQSHISLTEPTIRNERAVITCIEQLEKNVNAKLALDRLFFIISGNV